MYWKHKVIYIVLFLGILAKPAQGSSLTINEIGRQERELAYQWAKLEQLNLNYGRLVDVYDRQYAGNGGLIESVDQFNSDNLQWLNRWDQLLNIADLAYQLDVTSLVKLSSTLGSFLEDQRAEFVRLEQNARHIRGLANQIVARSQRIDFIHPENFSAAEYKTYVMELNQRVNDLIKHAGSVQPVIDGRMKELEFFYTAVQDRVKSIVREMLLQQGTLPLTAAIQLVDELFLVDQLATPLFEGVKQEYQRLRRYEYMFLIFHAEESLENMAQSIAQLRKIAARNELPSFYVDDYLKAMESYYQLATERIAGLEEYPRSMLVALANEELVRYFQKRIKDQDKTVNQRLLQTMAMLSEQHLETLSSDELRKVEFLWNDVGSIE